MYANENCTVSVTFDNIHAVPDSIRGGVISLRFDDSWASYYTEAKTRMDEYGYPGIAATITGIIKENRTRLLSVSDLREMQDSGWDIISHCHNPQGRLDTKDEIERSGFWKTGLSGAQSISRCPTMHGITRSLSS